MDEIVGEMNRRKDIDKIGDGKIIVDKNNDSNLKISKKVEIKSE